MSIITLRNNISVSLIRNNSGRIVSIPWNFFSGERITVTKYRYQDLEEAYDLQLENGDCIYGVEEDHIHHIL